MCIYLSDQCASPQGPVAESSHTLHQTEKLTRCAPSRSDASQWLTTSAVSQSPAAMDTQR